MLWGRRRVGKTFLLTHFAEGKRQVYFTATRQDSEQRQVQRYAGYLQDQLGEDVADLIGGGFTDWEAALRFTLRMAAEQPLLVVLDEAPRLLLALSGSAVSMEQMLGPQGGLHRRAALERRLDPFSFTDARAFLPRLAAAEYVEAYAGAGGTETSPRTLAGALGPGLRGGGTGACGPHGRVGRSPGSADHRPVVAR